MVCHQASIKLRRLILCSLLALPLWARAGDDFSRSLTAEEFNEAGLSKLSPQERAKLEAFIERYRGKPAAKAALPAPPPAEARKPAKLTPEWVSALITLQRSEGKSDSSQVLESALTGDFSGWFGRTTFRLENGQLWAQVNGDTYKYTPPLHAPKVKIYPASFGTFWMEVAGVSERCRVKPVKLE